MNKPLEKDRINEIIEAVMKVARGDYSVQIKLSGENDELDSLGIGLNMMIDDIREHITELKRAEEERWEAATTRERAAIIDVMHDSLILLGLGRKIIYANPAHLKMFGHKSIDEIVGKSIEGFKEWFCDPEKDTSKFLELFNRVIEKGFCEPIEITFRKKDGKEFVVNASGSLLRDAGGNPKSVIVILRDITERKQAEEVLSESEEKFRSLVQTIPECVYSALPNGEILYMSPAVKTIFGYSAEEFQKDKNLWIRLIHKDDQKELLIKLEKLLTQGTPYIHEFRMKRKDENIVWIRDHATAVLDEKGKRAKISGIIYDITERKKTEEELVRLAGAVKMSIDGIVIGDIDAKIIDVNETILKMYGTEDKGDLIGKNSFDLIVPEEREKAFAGMKETLEKGYTKGREYHIITKDGSKILVELNSAIMKDVYGKPIGFVSIVRDIRERKRAEDALRKSENESRTLLENLPQKVFFKDRKSVYIAANENYARDLKIKFGGITGKTDYDFFPKKLAEKYRADDKRIMESGKTEDIEEEYIQDGQKVFVHTVKTPVKDENGNVVGVLGIFWDVTERKKAGQALRASLERYQSFIEVTGELGWTTNADGEVLEDIPSFRNFTGQTYEEVKGWGWLKALHPDDLERTTRIWKEANRTKSKYEIEYRLRRHDGVYRYFMARGVPVLKEDGSIREWVGTCIDITEHRRTQKALEESEEKYRNLAENLNEIVYRADPETFVANYVNSAVKEIYGYTVEEWLKNPNLWEKTIHPDDKDRVFAEMMEAKRKLKNCSLEYRIVREDKTIRWMRDHMSWEKDPKGRVVSVNGVMYDITERKKAEESLEKERKDLDRIIDSSPIIIFYKDKEGKFIRVNKTFAEAAKIPKEKFLGKTVFDFYSAKIARGMANDDSEVLELGRPKLGIIEQYESASGMRWVQTDKIPIFDKKGIPTGLVGFAQDITERKQMEDELRRYSEHLEELVDEKTGKLRESEERFRSIYEASPIGIELYDSDGRLLTVNKACLKIFGVSDVADVKGLKLFEDPNVTDEIKKRLRKGEGVRYETPFDFEKVREHKLYKTAKSGIIYLDVQMTPLVLKEKEALNGYLIHVRDITKRKRLEEKLLKTERLAAIGEVANMVGHDLRNPLQAIENAAYYLKNECARMPSSAIPPKAKEMLQVIGDSVNYADGIVRDLHDFSAAKKPLLKRIDINMLVKETLSQAEAPRNVEINTELSQLPEIMVDKDQMKRVFLNFITNGTQAMENEGTLTVSTKKAGGFVEVNFKDTGVGITKETMEKLFSPFFTTRAKGMGMGLSICKKFVESHGGSIEVETEEGKGSTFRVKLPLPRENGGENP